MLRSTALLGVVVVMSAGTTGGYAGGPQRGAKNVEVRIRPLPRDDRVDLEITTSFPLERGVRSRFLLPEDRYGTPRMHESVVSVEGLEGTSIESGKEPSERVVIAHTDAGAAVRHVVSWNPENSEGLAFSPSVDAAHFHFLGSQWMARHQGDDREYDFTISFVDVPVGWTALSSFGIGPGPHEVTATYDDLVSTVIAGGEYRSEEFDLQGQTVVTAIHGDFEMSDDDIFDAVCTIVTTEREHMPDIDQPFYTVCITEREGIRAGTSFLNAFTCLVRPDVSPERLMLLLAHEMFHYWLPNTGAIAGIDAHVSEMRYEWVHEGFTEYIARRIMLDEGLTTIDWFVERINDDLADLALSPVATITYDELRRREDAGEFTNIEEKIAYYRGPLIALQWDTTMRRASGGSVTLLEAIRDTVARAAAAGGRLDEQEFHGLMATYGIDVASTLQQHIIEGQPIEPPPDVFAPTFHLVQESVPGFEPDFDLRRSSLQETVIGVIPGSPAYEAGLRDGMTIAGFRNAWRHSSDWRADEPLTVVVEVNGEQCEITFHPRKTAVPLPRYVRARE